MVREHDVRDIELSPKTFDELKRKLRHSVETDRGEALLPKGVRFLRGDDESRLAVNQ